MFCDLVSPSVIGGTLLLVAAAAVAAVWLVIGVWRHLRRRGED